MKRCAGVVLAVAALAETVVASGGAAPRAAAPFSFSLDLRSGAFVSAPRPVSEVSSHDFEVLVGGKTIVTLPHPVLDVAASPDGRLVAAETYDASACTDPPPPPPCGAFAIWVMRRDGSGLRLFSTDARYPAWSRDSRRLAFVGGFDTATLTGLVSVADVDGAHRRALGAREAAARPAWAASGALVADTRTAGHGSIRVVRVADARVVAVLDRAGEPAWASSGQRLAFVRLVHARSALTLWSNGRMRVLATAGGIATLSWSPDGRRVAFATGGVGAAVGITRVDRRGARIFPLPIPGSNTRADVTDLVWKSANELLVAGSLSGIIPVPR